MYGKGSNMCIGATLATLTHFKFCHFLKHLDKKMLSENTFAEKHRTKAKVTYQSDDDEKENNPNRYR